MPITIYKDMLTQRIAASGWQNPMTDADLNAIQLLADKADSSSLKPVSRKKHPVEFSCYNIGKVPSFKIHRLGAGNYGKIYLHADASNDSQAPNVYAVKVVHLKAHTKESNQLLREGVNHEIEVLKRLGQYIRSGENVCSNNFIKLYVVMRYIPGTTLHIKLLEKKNSKHLMTISQAIDLMKKLVAQLAHLHALGYAHGDLHTGNIMINENHATGTDVHLIDFNLSRPKDKFYYINPPVKKNEYPHIPEECCNTNEIYFTPASDVYALGALFNSILSATIETYDSEGKDLKAPIRNLTQKMRASCDARLSLPEVEAHLNEISCRSVVSSKFLLSKTALLIPSTTKQEAILALQQYLSGSHTLRTYLFDTTFALKTQFFDKEIRQLQAIELSSEFCTKLIEGLINYIKTFAINDLEHYVSLSKMGRGIECYVNAIKVCRDEIAVNDLNEKLTKSLELQNSQGQIFLEKLQSQFYPSSMGNTSEHSLGAHTH